MRKTVSFLLLAIVVCSPADLGILRSEEVRSLWQIGRHDGANADLALAPGGYSQFNQDAFFIIGESEAKRDWPYVQPGPADAWAGGVPHAFRIVFGLETLPNPGPCRLELSLLDTHSLSPPRLRVEINGQSHEQTVPHGAGDASIEGDPSRGREQVWTVGFASEQLRPGNNEVVITSLSGSWVLYDAVRLETPAGAELKSASPGIRLVGVATPPVWVKQGGKTMQPVTVTYRYVGEPTEATMLLDGIIAARLSLKPGTDSVELALPSSEQERQVDLRIEMAGAMVDSTRFTASPPSVRELYIVPHSHVDIGYTHTQAETVDRQVSNLKTALRLIQESAAHPPGARFKWVPEAVWSMNHFLQQASPEERESLFRAVRAGDVEMEGLYSNLLTGLARPEALVQQVAIAARLAERIGVPAETAVTCDVPGWTWGLVPVLAQAGVKYFAPSPNASARIGSIHQWDDRPFYWKSPSGNERVLCWVTDNYHHHGNLQEHTLAFINQLKSAQFPYEFALMFWVGEDEGRLDNSPPDEQIMEKVMAWNERYAAPRLVIGTVTEFFHRFEPVYGAALPEFSGDLTPYWEDGAGSTALETAMNATSSDRLSQAETLFAMRAPRSNPHAAFADAWQNVLLYSEHTWGADESISRPDSTFTRELWQVKRAFAVDADRQSRELLQAALPATKITRELDVFNTTQWERTDLAVVPRELGGESVLDEYSQPVPCQRLASGELAFLASNVPPYGARRYRLSEQRPPAVGKAEAASTGVKNALVSVILNPKSGAIQSLRLANGSQDFVDSSAPVGLNDYRYVLGNDSENAQSNGPVHITILENGPLVASLRIESDAPGCNRLVREVRVVDGLDRVELVDHVDRPSVRAKDGIHFGFGFNVPAGTVRMETPWAVVRPNADQLPGSCRNWFTVQRWVDVSNRDHGITLAPIDAPLIEIGDLTANLMGSVALHEWLPQALDSPIVYSWAQNNHWFTNYKADQPGVSTFRYLLRPHLGGYSGLRAARFGLETTRPLQVAAASAPTAPGSLLSVSPPDVMVETVKVSDDGKALIVRLFGISGKPESAVLSWIGMTPTAVSLTDLRETPLTPIRSAIPVPAQGLVNVRAELPPALQASVRESEGSGITELH